MDTNDLRAELRIAEAALWSLATVKRFKSKFPLRALLEHAPGLGVARVEASGGLYQPHDAAGAAVIAAVWVRRPVDLPNGTRSAGVLDDLAAIDLSSGAVALRCGFAIALGEHLLGAENRPARVACFLDGLSWLRAGGNGVMPLDWRAVAREAAGLDLLCDTVEAGETVQRRLTETLPRMPRVLVRDQRRTAA